jgi:imidazolonepropionase
MSSFILTHIRELINVRQDVNPLYGNEMAILPSIKDAWLLVEGNQIAGFGEMESIKKDLPVIPSEQLNCKDRLVMPCWCDSHTHLVFAGSRENEFVDKILGLTYSEIHARGGGILSTVQKVRESSEDVLFQLAWKRLEELSLLGTGAIEIKSGYGLSVESELKMLRVIKKLRQKSSLQIRSTFLGAHAYPIQFRDNHELYIKQIIEKMLPAIADEKLADYIDVFCERGFFDPEESATILRAGMSYGLLPKMHVNQLHSIGGIETGLNLNAVSMDHLETLEPDDIEIIKSYGWKGFCTLLPTAAWFLRLPFPPVRALMDGGMAVALASDFNPGSSPSGNMNIVFSLACSQMKLLPEEALNACTTNGAFAMGLGNICGTISKGYQANLLITKPVPSLAYLPYSFGSNLIDKVIHRGSFIS